MPSTSFPWVRSLLALVAVAAVSWWSQGRIQRHRVERAAAAAIAPTAGRSVQVHCPGPLKALLFESTEGRVQFDAHGRPTDATTLTKVPCRGLRTVLDDRPDLTCLQRFTCTSDATRAAGALAVLAHEAVHLSGVIDEGTAECLSRRQVAGVATRLGLSPASGEAVARWQATDWAERLPLPYQRDSC